MADDTLKLKVTTPETNADRVFRESYHKEWFDLVEERNIDLETKMKRNPSMNDPLIIGLTGPRGVGKTEVAKILAKKGFVIGHAFGPGKAMVVAYYTYIGIDAETAQSMVYGDLKDAPCEQLPGGVASRVFMERFGYFMGVDMGSPWTLQQEVTHIKNNNPMNTPMVFESIVYEADYFRHVIGGVIVRVVRPYESKIKGEKTDEVQAMIEEDYTLYNAGSLFDLEFAINHMLARNF